jgi:HAD superfamily phosphoserine phosphatase-like hydrolase
MRLILFDFDGTLTTKDSLNEFLKFSVGKRKYFLKLFLFMPLFILYKLKLIKNNKAKEMLFSFFFKNIEEDVFKEIAKEYSLTQIDKILDYDIYNEMIKYKENEDKVIIVSASIECWLKPWCQNNNIELISTKLEFINNKFTGKFKTKNCYGMEKVNRIKEYLNINEYEEIIVYGDSAGDYEMFNISNKHFKINR